MSDFENVQESWMCCCITGCIWSGYPSELEDHFDWMHPQQMKFSYRSYFQLTFDDLENQTPFLLSTNNGMYWFKMNENQYESEQLSRGIFDIGNSETIEYRIKLGTLESQIVEILGPFETKEEHSDKYDLCIQLDDMERIKATMIPKVIIYFGNCDEEDDEIDEFIRNDPITRRN